MSLIFILTVWIFATFAVAASRKQTHVCLYAQTRQSPLDQMCAKVQCKKDHVISHLHTETGDSNTTSNRGISKKRPDPNQTCLGETASSIHKSNDCFWKRNCRFGFPKGKIIRTPLSELNDDLPDCFNKNANFLCILDARCTKQSEIIDASKENCTDGVIPIRRSKGIIRSHQTYPWLQGSGVDVNATSECLFKKTIKSEAKVAFYDLDLDDESAITIATALKTITVNNTHYTSGGDVWDVSDVLEFSSADEYITFKFAQELTRYTYYRGFVICFKENKGKKQKRKLRNLESGRDFCIEIMRKARFKKKTFSFDSRKCKSSVKGKSIDERKYSDERRACCCFPENKATCKNTRDHAWEFHNRDKG